MTAICSKTMAMAPNDAAPMSSTASSTMSVVRIFRCARRGFCIASSKMLSRSGFHPSDPRSMNFRRSLAHTMSTRSVFLVPGNEIRFTSKRVGFASMDSFSLMLLATRSTILFSSSESSRCAPRASGRSDGPVAGCAGLYLQQLVPDEGAQDESEMSADRLPAYAAVQNIMYFPPECGNRPAVDDAVEFGDVPARGAREVAWGVFARARQLA